MKQATCPPDDQEFSEPWHAQLFAITIVLHEKGIMSWPEWSAMLAAELADWKSDSDGDNEDEYYGRWQTALEKLLCNRDLVGETELQATLVERKAGTTANQDE